MEKRIVVRLSVEGIHHWPSCDIEEVDYLKLPHRHMFNIVAKKKVVDSDREIEFIKMSHQIKKYLKEKFYSPTLDLLCFGSKSCEMIAEELLTIFELSECEVNEDGEGGAIISEQWV